MLRFLSIAFFLAGLACAYWLIVRPILRARGWCPGCFSRTDAFLAQLKGYRTVVVAKLTMLGSALLALYDWAVPLVADVDWQPLAAQVPSWLWPLALFALAALFRWLRKLTSTPEGEAVG